LSNGPGRPPTERRQSAWTTGGRKAARRGRGPRRAAGARPGPRTGSGSRCRDAL